MDINTLKNMNEFGLQKYHAEVNRTIEALRKEVLAARAMRDARCFSEEYDKIRKENEGAGI